MSEREQFEAWVKSKDSTAPLHRRDMKGSERIGQYCTHWIQDQWEAWQASRRAALEEAATVCDRMVSVSAVSYETGSACARDIRAIADGDTK